jgi:hypothetical protein
MCQTVKITSQTNKCRLYNVCLGETTPSNGKDILVVVSSHDFWFIENVVPPKLNNISLELDLVKWRRQFYLNVNRSKFSFGSLLSSVRLCECG